MTIKKQIIASVIFIVGVAVILGGCYFGIKQYQNFQKQKIESERKNKEQQESLAEQQKSLTEQQGSLTEQQKELEDRIKELEDEPPTIIIKEINPPIPKNQEISAQEIEPYLTGIGRIDCKKDYNITGYSNMSIGSCSLWNITGIGYAVLTNGHVIADIPLDIGYCVLNVADAGDIKADKNRTAGGFFWLGLEQNTRWNTKTDVAVIKITYDFIYGDPPTGLNYSIGSLPLCEKMLLNSPVVVIGFPASTMKITDSGIYAYRTITNGIISAYDESAITEDKLPYANYFVSAKIDSGNSGGMAFSKNSNGLCLLGIPTWISLGNYDNQGIIQNINNVMYVGN